MTLERCKECGDIKFDWKEHRCDPIYEVLHEEYNGDEIMDVRGCSIEDAAENYGREYNEDGDCALMNDSIEIRVRKLGDTDWKSFIVSAELDVNYSVRDKD